MHQNFEVLRQVKVNIPLLDMIKQVPTYAKFLKDLCTIKRGLNVNKKAFLTEQVSAIIQCKSPVKYKDPGCPTISVSIEGLVWRKLCWTWEQISEDSKRMIEDVLVQVDKFYYPVDFVVLDTNPVVKGTNYVPIILGRPFLATSNAIINCRNGVMQLTFGNMTLELNIFHLYKKHIHPEEEEDLLATLLLGGEEEILPLFNEEERQRAVKEEPPKLILKPLPTELKYAYLEEDKKCLLLYLQLLPFIRRIVYLKSLEDRRLNPHMQEVVRAEVLKLLQAGIIYPISDSPWVSPTQVVPKKSGIRWCKMIREKMSLHASLQVLERVSVHPFYCFLDGYSGYFQIEIDVEDQEKTTFMCPFGTYAYRRMPFSLCNAPATFQRCMLGIFSDMVEHIMEVFICHFMVHQGIVLGHIISKQGIEVDKAKVELIVKLPSPTNDKRVRQFLGHVEFYRRFIKDFSKLARPLCELLVKDAKFIWDEKFQRRAVLGQREDGKPYVIYYASKTLNEAQRNYTTTRKNC
ncbi:Retrovirus-related Pol polyprotein from transposon 17.6 [Vitis vinifera]|uniref:RNA-directed DNA polymerase n=1 Tax=Vitis vinifera TaxID=29760 RepID=A0A438I2S0_VITVI|nr:Retrovirus-related Pol polyprotein from transposon 17.6 [Vitis vinifera]